MDQTWQVVWDNIEMSDFVRIVMKGSWLATSCCTELAWVRRESKWRG